MGFCISMLCVMPKVSLYKYYKNYLGSLTEAGLRDLDLAKAGFPRKCPEELLWSNFVSDQKQSGQGSMHI